ncbi:MAG: hypothetical protein SFW67_04095 [Myxococcaceae bacterium]|nr:hypothetical protein [Myxococcaceae bacterium]
MCWPTTDCGFCSGDSSLCQVCGCNGITYGSPQEACVAGARFIGGACGMTGPGGVSCGASSQCRAGETCCSLTGKCFSPNESWRCAPLADGGVLDCASDTECGPSGIGGGAAGPSYCAGDQCGAPGKCMPLVSSRACPGTVVPVCGCDGKDYLNECWARASGTRVATPAPCGADLTWEPATVDFGSTAVGQAATLDVTFFNRTSRPLQLTGIAAREGVSPSSTFTVVAANPGDVTQLTVPAGRRESSGAITPGTARVTVQFRPNASASRDAVLVATTDVASLPSLSIALLGRGAR